MISGLQKGASDLARCTRPAKKLTAETQRTQNDSRPIPAPRIPNHFSFAYSASAGPIDSSDGSTRRRNASSLPTAHLRRRPFVLHWIDPHGVDAQSAVSQRKKLHSPAVGIGLLRVLCVS